MTVYMLVAKNMTAETSAIAKWSARGLCHSTQLGAGFLQKQKMFSPFSNSRVLRTGGWKTGLAHDSDEAMKSSLNPDRWQLVSSPPPLQPPHCLPI